MSVTACRLDMTEEEWHTTRDVARMLRYLDAHQGISDRKLRLFICACWRRRWHLMQRDRQGTAAVRMAERFEAGRCGRPKFAAAWRRGWNGAGPLQAAALASGLAAALASTWNPRLRTLRKKRLVRQAEEAAHAALLRDIAGNPFRLATLDPAYCRWQHGTPVALARAIWDERRFHDLPVLADALEEAGCTDAEILAHCRHGGMHVLGCWVLDLVLRRD
jgi:hypothetical protein